MLSRRLTFTFVILLLSSAFAPLAPPAAAAPPAPLTGTSNTFLNYAAPSNLGPATGEPSLGVNWVTGNVMMSVTSRPPLNIPPSQKFARITFDDSVTPPSATWSDVSGLIASRGNVDPMLFTDAELGRTFAGGLDGACSVMAYSDDDGQSWLPMANPCASGPVGDHQSIASGPYAAPLDGINPVWDHAVYYCSQGYPNGVVLCSRSDDGGITFHQGTQVPCGFVNPGLHGSVEVGHTGVVWVPFRNGQGQVCVSRSMDNGLTWTGIKIPGTAGPAHGFDPDVATTPTGWTYVGYENGDGTAHVALTKDNGTSWTISPDLGAAFGLKTTTFHEMVAGDDQRAAVAFLGTTGCCVNDAFTSAAFTGEWNLYVAFTYDGGMTWSTVKASDDPVQRGCIWDGGGTNDCRNLLDFMDADVDEVGRVLVGFADGCRGACATPSGTPGQSRDAWATIARQNTGRGLFAQYDGTSAGLAVNAGGPYSGFVGGAIAVAGTVGGGTAPYSFAWSLASKPSGSTATFANPNALSTTFTPDLAGAYTLRLTVTDAASATQSATATLTTVAMGACGTSGVLVSQDAATDGGGAGPATDVQCLRAADDASSFDVFIDLAGTTLSGATQATYTVSMNAEYAANLRFALVGTWNGNVATGYMLDPTTGTKYVGRVVTATMEGSTLHLRVARSDIFSPADGQKLTSLYADVTYCPTSTCTHADYAPDAMNGQYVFGSSPTSGMVPLARCGLELAVDPSGDAPNGIRDLVSLRASDDADTLTFCAAVRDWSDRPAGVGQIQVGWTADYETGKPYYFVDVNVNPDGTLASSNLYKGNAVGLNAGPVPSQRNGNVLEIDIPKSMVGNPVDATSATGVVASTSADGAATSQDATPSASFRFGQKVPDVEVPSQVDGLAVADLQTGSTLRLTWTAATDDTGVVSYVVKRATQSGGPYATIATPAGTAYTDTGLATGETFWYVVAAKDAADNVGPDSAEASGVPTPRPPDTTPPTVPGEPVVSGTETDLVSITWLPSADAESGVAIYKVWRDGAFAANVAGTTFTDGGLQPDTTYLYEVAAVNGDGLESARASISGTTLPLPPPDCGQTGYVLLTDPDFDGQGMPQRADVIRVSVHERDDRIWFHVGARDLSPAQAAVRDRVVFTYGDTTYAVVGGVDDDGAFALGVYRQVQLPTGDWAEARTSQDVLAEVQCNTLILGVKPADVGSPPDGGALTNLRVETTQDASSNAAMYDRAPNTGAASFVVGTSNLPPVLAALGDQTVAEGDTLAFTLGATDANGDPLTFSATSLPIGATLDPSTGAFSWTPTYHDAATYVGVAFAVSDGKASDEETITLRVTETDTTPTLQPIGDRSIAEGQTLAFTVLASDADGDALTLSATGLPEGATFDAQTGAFTWTAPYQAGHAAGSVAGVTFTATDGRNPASEVIDITVADVNRAPVLAPIGNQVVGEGQTLTFVVGASDPDGDVTSVTASGLPAGAAFDGTTFSWATAFGDAGNHPVAFTASDGALTDQESVVLTVGDVNRPPVLNAIADQSIAEGQTLSFTASATDPDGQAVTYSSPNLPIGATLNPTTGAFSWTPGFGQSGVYPNVQVVASDGQDASVATFAIAVANVDRAPVLGAIAKLNVDETATAARNVAATDADGDAIALTASGLPEWATFTDNGDGTGRILAHPPGGAEGTYTVTLRATSGALADEKSFDVVVKRKVAVTVGRIGAATLVASPGEVVTLTATVRNDGTQLDTFTVTTSGPAGWARGATSDVTLAPGETATVAFPVTVPATGGSATVSLTARSQATTSVARSTSWLVTTPMTVRVTFAKATFGPADEVTGVAKVTWANGEPVTGASVRVEQTPRVATLGPSLASSASGTTDANGEAAFTFARDAASRMPGAHDVKAYLGAAATMAGAYSVG